MNYGKINTTDIANGTGIRVSLFVSGCRRQCPGCFNLEAQDFNYGNEFTKSTAQSIMFHLENSWVSGLSILGGEPFEPENLIEVSKLVRLVRARFKDRKTIWMYSGYCWEDLLKRGQNEPALFYILHNIDILVDGPFIEQCKDINLKFRGSSNQRIIDVSKSIESGYVILADI